MSSGITHNVPAGEYSVQANNIFEITSNLVKEYIKNPEMVILVVIPADSDFQNAAALKLAKEVDPEGIRTLGVVTKVSIFIIDVLFCAIAGKVHQVPPCCRRYVMPLRVLHLASSFKG